MAHIHEKIDFCAEVFIVYNNKVLSRVHDKLHIWLSVGGHIELDEDPNEAAIREVKKEVGLDVVLFQEKSKETAFNNTRSLIPPQYLNRHFITKDHEHISLIYFARAKTDKLTLSKTEVSEECRWFTKEEIQRNDYNINPDIRFYALKALENLSSK